MIIVFFFFFFFLFLFLKIRIWQSMSQYIQYGWLKWVEMSQSGKPIAIGIIRTDLELSDFVQFEGDQNSNNLDMKVLLWPILANSLELRILIYFLPFCRDFFTFSFAFWMVPFGFRIPGHEALSP